MLHVGFWLMLFSARFYLSLITFNVYAGLSILPLVTLSFSSTILIAGVYYCVVGLVRRPLSFRHGLYMAVILLVIIFMYTVLDALAEQFVLNSCSNCMLLIKSAQPAYYGLLRGGIINIVLKRLLSLGVPFYLLLTLSIPLCIKFALNSWRRSVEALQQTNHNIQLEFDLLKNQISPHFLFNSLNNIYGLILSGQNKRSANLVARLSSLLRYMLYETNDDYMPIEMEVQLLKDYFELEKIRLNDTDVKIAIDVDQTSCEIPPLLLFPVVENAFKYCPDIPGSQIRFALVIAQGHLCMTLENSVSPMRGEALRSGIGLQNFKKRLDLCYPNGFKYNFEHKDRVYKIYLDIDLWKGNSVA